MHTCSSTCGCPKYLFFLNFLLAHLFCISFPHLKKHPVPLLCLFVCLCLCICLSVNLCSLLSPSPSKLFSLHPKLFFMFTQTHISPLTKLSFTLPHPESLSAWGEKEVRVVGCPFDGRYTFTHERGAGGACPHPTSEMSNCPLGFGYNVTYRDCTFSSVPISEYNSISCSRSIAGLSFHTGQ